MIGSYGEEGMHIYLEELKEEIKQLKIKKALQELYIGDKNEMG